MNRLLTLGVFALCVLVGGCPKPPPTPPVHFIAISWDEPVPVDSFTVYRAAGQTTPVPVVTQASKSYTDNAVLAGETYEYYVTAEVGGAVSDSSNVLTVTVPSP